ncbi:hypothetical protein I546_7173 [Mycobacterium kansasii 732]|nr:hypothetical protein I546_7173 [Mycobacterium kansasii 732]
MLWRNSELTRDSAADTLSSDSYRSRRQRASAASEGDCGVIDLDDGKE